MTKPQDSNTIKMFHASIWGNKLEISISLSYIKSDVLSETSYKAF